MRLRTPLLSLLALALALPGRAEEGMWTFDNLPLKQLKEKYQFEPGQAWIDHVRLSSLSLGGCSGSFVSAEGLVLTNHHCTRGSIARLSSKDRDMIKDGFVAMDRSQEIKMPGLTYRTLMAMENVTERVAQAVKPGMTEKQAAEARAKALDALKSQLEKKQGLTFETVNLYQGGETWMYGYKLFKDVRLVAAPEIALAAFGGDWDNFTYPRHDLDFSLVRVYEDGKPYNPPHHLTWSTEGLQAGDLTFVVGHPGRTYRQYTLAQMTYDRTAGIPDYLKNARRTVALLEAFGQRGPEQARQVQTLILGVANGLKNREGALKGLQDAAAMKRIEAAEQALRAAVAQDPRLQASTGGSWARIEKALKDQEALRKPAAHLGAARSTTLGQALAIVRLGDQLALPEAKRLTEYRGENSLKTLRARLAGPAAGMMGMTPGKDLEIHLFTCGLEDLVQALGASHPYVKAMLGGRKPAELAKELVETTQLGNPATRKALVEGGQKAVAASPDPMIILARKLEPMLLALRLKQDALKAVIDEHAARIAKARFAVYGKTLSPDATGTLRVSYGTVSAYPANGTLIQPFTTFAGLYDRHWGWGGNAGKANTDWKLPQRWLDRMSQVDLKTPFNFAHAVDTVGGNSGSPVVNRKGELVGLLFDGNIDGLPGSYFYDERVNRSVSVDVRSILEALGKVYDAPHLVKELLAR